MNERASTKIHYCDVVYLSSVEHSKSIGFLDRVYLISGAVSDVVQPRSQGFPRFEGDQRSMFESANGVYVSGFEFVYVIDQ